MTRVFVTSVPDEFRDLVEVYAESESRGGGRLASYGYDTSKQCVAIEFIDEGDARRFIDKESLVILTHSMPILKAPCESTIFVYDVPLSLKDDLDCILESPRKGGGPIKEFSFMEELKCAKVTFEEKAVAKHFVEQAVLKIANERLHISFLPPNVYRPKFKFHVAPEVVKREPFTAGEEVSLPSSLNPSGQESFCSGICDGDVSDADGGQADREDSIALRAFNLPSILNAEYLKLALENKRFGGGILKSYEFNENERTAIFSFENDEMAYAMLSKGKIFLDKTNSFQVERLSSSRKDSLCQREEVFPKSSDQDGKAESRLVGLKIGRQETEDKIILYAENRRSNGGPIEKIYELKPKIFVLQFKFAKDAKSFCSKDHTSFFEGKVHTIMLQPWPENVRSCAINVTGFDKVTAEALRLFFENKRSGGEPNSVDQVVTSKDIACITFKDPSVVTNILAKGEWKYGQQELKVVPCRPACPPPLFDSDVAIESHWLRFTEIKLPSLNHKEFKEYISMAALTEVAEVNFEKESCRALARFRDVPNYEHILETLCSRPFHGIMISVERLPVCDTILVTSQEKCSPELLRLYFENSRSGGGHIKAMQQHQGPNVFIIQFKDASVVDNVVKKSHKCDNINLTVKAYRDDSFYC